MALVAGTVTIADDETVTGTGYAGAVYDADAASVTLPSLPVLGAASAPYSAQRPVGQTDVDAAKKGRLLVLRELARRANAYASATVAYFQANAQVNPGSLAAHVTNQRLGALPSAGVAGEPIAAPSVPVDVPLTGAGSIS